MRINVRTLIVISVAILGVLFTWRYINANNQQYTYRQVKAIAPTDSNYILPFTRHIRHSIRPNETFSFPIKLGSIGPTTSLYSGPTQYPFYCMTIDSGLGQPQVDNTQGYGVPVYASLKKQQDIIGYSKDCNVASQVFYLQIMPDRSLKRIKPIKQEIPTQKSRQLLRVEQGTINRFIYTIIMPVNENDIGSRISTAKWNKRLIYQFNGGSGIGFRQGKQRAERVINRQMTQLLAGYAVVSSSGNKTSYTYNMLLAEDTARRVKKQFVSLYGEPLYTVGVGGSGGGLAQYLIAQNSTGILDGLIPQYSYPDMITTATYALDCDLLNNYYTFRASQKNAWQNWDKRKLIEGLNSKNDHPQRGAFLQPMNQLMAGFIPSFPKGNSECINGYFGLSSFINNPRQGFLRNFFHDEVVAQVNWSYWQDLYSIFSPKHGNDNLTTWDNVGVQYGLKALVNNDISIETFIDINKKVGGWKPQVEMQTERLFTPFGKKLPIWLSLWGNHNITNISNSYAMRKQGSIKAMHAAYRAGQVFIGKVNLPIIDVRHYLEDDLDMHHLSASFYSRLRLKEANGHWQNQVIWVADKNYDPTSLVFQYMDKWLLAIKKDKIQGVTNSTLASIVIKNKPKLLKDTCFDASGEIIESADNAWFDKWHNTPLLQQGKCAKAFPIYSNSRIQAGSNWKSDIFKCRLISVNEAIARNHYGKHDMSKYKPQLKMIFPDGVCDYTQPDVGRPKDI